MPDLARHPVPPVLVIGCGSIGQRHLRNVLTLGAREVTVWDSRTDHAQTVAARLGVRAAGTAEEAWSSPRGIAIIATPTRFHLDSALAAADRGFDLFIEKPLSDSLEGLEPLLGRARDRRLVTLVGCNLRFHPALRAIKQLLDDSAIGRVVSLRVEFGQYLPDWHPGEDYRAGYSARRDLGGGVILDVIHEIDYIRWLGGEISAVACFAGKVSTLEIESEDTAEILLQFTSGAIGEVHLDYVQRAYSRTCQIIGEQGTIRWEFGGPVRWYCAQSGEWRTIEPPEAWQVNDMYLDELRHLLECVHDRTRTSLDVFEGRRVLEVALAARTAARQCKVISLGS